MTVDTGCADTTATAAPADRISPVARVLLAAIRGYRTVISPTRPPSCRYLPTCSEYAADAVRTWGPARGGWLAVRRLLRCHPWHAGGYDPAPARPHLDTGNTHPAEPVTRAAA